ncbi:MAG: SAF domain-containing protein [Actinomycetes bacterium]
MADTTAVTRTAPLGGALPAPPARRSGRPRWFDLRLITGVLLVLVSIVVGARVVAASDSSEPVWVAGHDLAAGTQLSAGDFTHGRVHLYGERGTYISARSGLPTGYVLIRPIGKGELLPTAAVAPPGQVPTFRLVTVQVAPLHVPLHLGTGDRVDVYVTPRATGSEPQPARLVFPAAIVAAVSSGSRGLTAGSTDTAVVLEVPPRAVAGVLAGVHGGDVDLVMVPTGQS